MVEIVVLDFWKKIGSTPIFGLNLAADPGVVGTAIRLNGEPHTIVGVAPRNIEAIDHAAVLLKPLTWPPRRAAPLTRRNWGARMFARLKPGVRPAEAQEQLAVLEHRYFDAVAPPSS